MKGLEGLLFRPQGKPMAYPYTMAARFSQFPLRFAWNEAFVVRYFAYSYLLVVLPLGMWIDSKLTSPENKLLWKEKRKLDREHHEHEMAKVWEIRT